MTSRLFQHLPTSYLERHRQFSCTTLHSRGNGNSPLLGGREDALPQYGTIFFRAVLFSSHICSRAQEISKPVITFTTLFVKSQTIHECGVSPAERHRTTPRKRQVAFWNHVQMIARHPCPTLPFYRQNASTRPYHVSQIVTHTCPTPPNHRHGASQRPHHFYQDPSCGQVLVTWRPQPWLPRTAHVIHSHSIVWSCRFPSAPNYRNAA